jgi:hypothetical protein
MKPYAANPLTPRMLVGLRDLQTGKNLSYASTSVGRPTKQRLAKFGLATFDTPKDWNGPMHITARGLQVVQESPLEEKDLRGLSSRPRSWRTHERVPEKICRLLSLNLAASSTGVSGRFVVSITPLGREWLRCTCPQVCDCQSPDTNPGLCSNNCPEHNLHPLVTPDCSANHHRNGAENAPKFLQTSCSHCGAVFGPGNHGYSHCADHAGVRKLPSSEITY